MAEIAPRVRLIGGDHLDVGYEETGTADADEVAEQCDLGRSPRTPACFAPADGDRLVVLFGRGIAAIEVAPRGAVL